MEPDAVRIGGTMRKQLIAATGLVAAGALLGACGGSDDNKESKSRGTTATTRAAGGTTTTGAATVKTAQTGLGTVLVDAQGKTLYLYANDQGTTSAVPPNILAAWPPLVASGAPVAGDGVDASKLKTAQQPDGQTWVTYDDHLLYTFSGDQSAGQTNGHKLGNVWYAVTPSGAQAP
jgi:predicted lipoprotein with Yx(FWY)xxD motif